MYKVFVNDIPIILSTEKYIGKNYTSLSIKRVKIKSLIKQMVRGELTHINLYHSKEKKLLKILKKSLPVVVAGGGMVHNNKGKILFIYRNGKWDLPKGKLEKNETIEECALREVWEETGVENLKISEFITTTYHVFKRNNKLKLKETHWYKMTSDYEGELKPEAGEGIKKVKWKNFEKSQKALLKSYENIKILFPKEYLITNPKDRIA